VPRRTHLGQHSRSQVRPPANSAGAGKHCRALQGQAFVVLLAGATLGLRRGAAGMVLYVLAGIAGMPWVAQHHGGTAVVHAASFGYLLAPSPQPWSARWPPAAVTGPCCAPRPPWRWGRW